MIPKHKREPTLREIIEQRKKKAVQAQAAPEQKPEGWQKTREDRIKTMVENNPEQVADLLRELFLKDNKRN